MKNWFLLLCAGFVCGSVNAQLIFYKEKIYSPYTLNDAKSKSRRDRMIKSANSLTTLPIGADSDTSEPIDLALWDISQFMLRTPSSDSGIARLVNNFGLLSVGTQRALLEVLYGLYPKEYYTQMIGFMKQSSHPKNFAIAASYIYRAHPSEAGRQIIQQQAGRLQTNESQALMIRNLLSYIDNYNKPVIVPDMDSLFAWQQIHKFKVVYSFQRKNRDFPGLAIVQNSDGSFVKDSTGSTKTFVQLARSASNIPWFITNGSTPQGLYSITGTGFAKNPFIGPTPNLQLVMMNEATPPTFTHYFPPVFNAPPERLYKSYFPANWQNWSGMMEAYNAGKIGRSEIIAHGSTIDPAWYEGNAFYPLTPTMGCLSALEIWNKETGRIDYSHQLDLVNAFIETPGTQGYLIVINIDDQQEAVKLEEIQQLTAHYENTVKKMTVALVSQ
jgi:hypothetical protein